MMTFDGFEMTVDGASFVHFTVDEQVDEEDAVEEVCNAKCYPVIWNRTGGVRSGPPPTENHS